MPPDGVDERGEIDEDEFQRTGPARQHLTWLGAGFVVGFAVPFLFTDVMQLPEISTTAST